jgi:hypothetical protein
MGVCPGFRGYAVKNKLVSAEDWFRLFQADQIKFYTILTQFLFRYLSYRI